ncbi:MAG TPA: FAD-dependent oxidoreductase [Herpetosiphonaceae bacterium]|nr:FAD-dependent oxidoreductase [Herpetosiphonaceae bacterium]
MNTPERFVIIGADAAGMSAASEARRVDPDLEMIAYDRGAFASYSQCGLPYLIGSVVEDHRRLIARTVEEFAQRGITVRLEHEVTAIDPGRKIVRSRELASGAETEQGYDRLVIATGASPVRLQLPGLYLDGVFHLDVMEDALAMQGYLRTHQPKQAVIVGGGYIGLEMAENLVGLGLQVRLVQRSHQLFPSVDVDIASALNQELERHGVDLSVCDSVLQACEGHHGRVVDVHTNQGEVPADLVLLATGTRPNVALAQTAGIRLGSTGAIAVDDHLRTSVPDIFAAGDCAEHWHRLLQRATWVPLGTTANKQGRIAGRNAAGGDEAFAGIVGTAITRVFDLQVGRTGLTEREATAAGLACVATVLNSTDHAGYLPDAQGLTVKLVAEQGTGRLLGGQAIGRAGVDKRVDVLATALYADLTIGDLVRLDLAYAPPFNSVWDPVQVAATRLLRQSGFRELGNET